AVIIDKDRVKRFSCHLPLSKNSRIIGDLGLRHSAALGLAELADALCIVVSEERGTISVARDGDIRTLRKLEDIRQEIESYYESQSPPQTKKSRWLLLSANPWEKGVALGLAAVLWLAFGFQTEVIRRDFIIPVSYRNLPAEWIIESQDPREAAVSLVGSKQAFDLFDSNTLRMIVDMSNIKEGQQEILLSNRSVEHPSNLTVVNIQPSSLYLRAHELVPRNVPVRVQVTGTLEENLVLKEIEVSPETVKVLAARKNNDDLYINTEPIPLESIRTTTRLTPKLIQQSNLPFPDRRVPQITVTIKVEPKENQK
ncbi:MAG: diadenylate cyclase, partial [Syntrophales bacterium]|nr:diadenylate cyclase [Syntrophales bacterium]